MWTFQEPAGRFFSAAQRAQLTAVFEAILPGGTDNPGATDAGAAEYLDRLLAMDESTYYEIRDWKPLYVAGLAMLSSAARSRFNGRDLPDLKPDEITALLTDLAAGKLAGFPDAAWQQKFFAAVRGHCIEGCFADRRWGGNQDNVMWRWYGYPTGPAVEFRRGAAAAAPAGAAVPSANTFTADKPVEEMQSATVPPELLALTVKANEAPKERVRPGRKRERR